MAHRGATGRAELALHGDLVDLDDDTIDLMLHVVTVLAGRLDEASTASMSSTTTEWVDTGSPTHAAEVIALALAGRKSLLAPDPVHEHAHGGSP